MPTLGEIASVLGVVVADADASRQISGVSSLRDATDAELSFLTSEKFAAAFASTHAAVVVVSRKIKLPEAQVHTLAVDDADLAMSKVLRLFALPTPQPSAGVDPAARVDASATLGDSVAIGPFVVVGPRARIGSRTVLHSGTYIGEDCTIGDDCQIFPNVVIRERVSIGSRVLIHACSAIGSDGFGYRWDGKQHAKIPHIGMVVIEDDVEIGSCVCIDRAKVGATRIGRGTKIDNLVQIAHNCVIGPHCVLAGIVGLAGSVTLGTGVVLGGQAAVRDHVTVGDGVMVAACSAVTEDVPAKKIVSGTPAISHRQMLREIAAVRRLPELLSEFQKLREEFDDLKTHLPHDE
jgi:UDP-3-O-[3-hydroxymyristoyl] glucosamine N-acyltransferase